MLIKAMQVVLVSEFRIVLILTCNLKMLNIELEVA